MRSSLAERPRRKLERLCERDSLSERPWRGKQTILCFFSSFIVFCRREEGYKITISGRGEGEAMERANGREKQRETTANMVEKKEGRDARKQERQMGVGVSCYEAY